MHSSIKKLGHKLPVVGTALQDKNNLATDKGILQLEKGELEATLRDTQTILNDPRNFLAVTFLEGNGIEIGAAQLPVRLSSRAKVQYVDIFTADELREKWPQDYTKLDIVEIDVVDDGEKLDAFKTGSLDFIIANHFLEHCLDPIGTILNMYKKLRPQGIIYMAVPDKRYTFDKKRPITTYDHLLEEHKDPTKKKFLVEHTEEFVKLGENHKGSIKKRSEEILASGYRVHYHVWTQREMTELFVRLAQDFKVDLEIEAIQKNRHEVIYVLRKEPLDTLR